jgi:hypothetical protein
MTDELDPEVLAALRAEAFRTPVRLGASDLAQRIDLDQRTRRRRISLLGTIAVAAAGLAVVLASTTLLPRPMMYGQGPSPTPACEQSAATKHGSWWSEMGGPRAFFNLESESQTATNPGSVWLLIVRVDPAPGSAEAISLWAQRAGAPERVPGRFNSPLDPANIARFDEQAPLLPGGWYLFEQPVPQAGCWTIGATVDGELAGSATVAVGPNGEAPDVGGVVLGVTGTAAWCGSIGGCAYRLELEGGGRHDRVKLRVSPDPDVDPETPIDARQFVVELDTPLEPLSDGSYTATLTSFAVSDVISNGQPAQEHRLASCSTTFAVGGTNLRRVVVNASFSASDCAATIRFVVLIGNPEYRVDCASIEPPRCADLAEAAAREALQHSPTKRIASISFSDNGSYLLRFDDGSFRSHIVD